MYNCSIQDFSTKEFVSLKKENSILYTWSWNTDISRELIDRQLEEFKNAGIGGIYILPLPQNFRPNSMKSFLEPEYLSKEYFELVKYAIEKGNELGILTWVYDEGGWPSGGACGQTAKENSKAAETILEKRELALKKGEKLIFKSNTVAVFRGKERLFEGFSAEEDIALNEYYTKKCDDAHPNRVDSTNKDVIDTFINNTYKKYKEGLGEAFKLVPAIFTDEPSVIRGLLPENLFEIFEEKYGYDLKKYLYCIFDSEYAETKEECQARIDYGRLVGELFYENFCKNLSDWCRKNNTLFTGHLDLDHLPDGASYQCYFSHLHALRCFDIPGVDVIWHQIRMPKTYETPVPEGVPFFPRLASSAAHQEGNNLALTESFGVYGDALTPDEFRYVLNYQAIRGINVFNIMLLGGNAMSSLIERPGFSAVKPGFYDLTHINTYFSRLSYLLRLGEPVIDTALYVPCADFWANDEIAQKASESYAIFGKKLEDADVEFDIIDDYVVWEADATERGLKIGSMCYKNVIVPDCEFMPEDVREKLLPYICNVPIANKQTVIRTMKRKLPSGMLYFFFNESAKPEELKACLNAMHLYRLNLSSGEVMLAKEAETIPAGEMVVLYASDKELPTVCNDVEYSAVIGKFEYISGKRFVISENGIGFEGVRDTTIADEEFSGEVTYQAEYELPEEPCKSDRYKIVLSETAVSARTCIDGKCIATFGMTPMEAIVSGAEFKKHGILEITVANTAANEIVRKDDMLMSLPAEIRGPYHDKSIMYEKNADALKFGKVEIFKLK